MKKNQSFRISVIGTGSWGTAFAKMTAESGHETILWGRRKEMIKSLKKNRINEKYLPQIKLSGRNLEFTNSLKAAVEERDLIVLAVPSFAMRKTLSQIRPHLEKGDHFLNLAKGVERGSFRTMSEIIVEEIPGSEVFTLSGPTHAEEVARGQPTAAVLAGNLDEARPLQKALSCSYFRLYISPDIKGVEYCGAIKNVIALATGIANGLGYGDNTTGALISRGLAEMVRFGTARGAHRKTFFGLAGIGDLVATCTSKHSRNRRIGERIGKGEELANIKESMDMVAEGLYATRSIKEQAETLNISMPITNSTYRVIEKGADPQREVNKLLERDYKVEDL